MQRDVHKSGLPLKLDLRVALGQCEKIGWLSNPTPLEQGVDPAATQASYVKCAARRKQLQPIDLLIGAGPFNPTAKRRPLPVGQGVLPNDFSPRTRTKGRETIGRGVPRSLVHNNIDDLRDGVSGPIDDHRVTSFFPLSKKRSNSHV